MKVKYNLFWSTTYVVDAEVNAEKQGKKDLYIKTLALALFIKTLKRFVLSLFIL